MVLTSGFDSLLSPLCPILFLSSLVYSSPCLVVGSCGGRNGLPLLMGGGGGVERVTDDTDVLFLDI
jgi:hypothetical protein